MRNLSIAGALSLFFLAFPVYAANPLSVVINEITWMGTIVSANDEWVELYNDTENPINLDDWQLAAQDETPKTKLSGTIPANGFYLLERTDDDTMPGITADLIYKGALSNSGEILELYDNFGNLIDSVNCSSGWFAGDNSTKQTMERKDGARTGSDPVNWQTSQNPGGTPKAKNSIVVQTPLENDFLTGQAEPQFQTEPPESVVDVKSQQITYPSGVVINEILPSPTGSDAEEEWIEIFNQNNFETDLSDWQVSDIEGKTNTYAFPKGTKISAQGFLVLSRPTTKITLNNDGDGLNLIQPDGKIIDSVNYEKAPSGQSYNRISSDWDWSAILTPGSANVIPAQKTEEAETLKEAGKIDINAAPLKDLVKIVQIGEVKALELISLRPFYSLDDLTRIKGIDDKALEDIKKQGLAWVDPALEPPQIKKTDPREMELAAVAELGKQGHLDKEIPKSLSIFLIAFGLAIFSGIIILILKKTTTRPPHPPKQNLVPY